MARRSGRGRPRGSPGRRRRHRPEPRSRPWSTTAGRGRRSARSSRSARIASWALDRRLRTTWIIRPASARTGGTAASADSTDDLCRAGVGPLEEQADGLAEERHQRRRPGSSPGRSGRPPSGDRAGPAASWRLRRIGSTHWPIASRRSRARARSARRCRGSPSSGPRISWTIPATSRPTCTSCSLSTAIVASWRYWTSRRTLARMISARVVLGDVIVGPGLEAGQDVVVVALTVSIRTGRPAQTRVGPDRPADRMAVGVRQIHVEDDRVRPDLARLGQGLAPARRLMDRDTGPAEDRPEQGPVRRAVVDDAAPRSSHSPAPREDTPANCHADSRPLRPLIPRLLARPIRPIIRDVTRSPGIPRPSRPSDPRLAWGGSGGRHDDALRGVRRRAPVTADRGPAR